MYCRTFAEKHTGVALMRFCADKTTATLIKQLEWLETWVLVNVPGSHLRVLRCDFGSEYAVQGRGDDYLTAALEAFCASRPDLRVIPCPPHAHAFVKVEGVVHSTAGHAFANACRANLGVKAWSLMEIGASYQHNVLPIWRPDDAPPGPAMSRIEALTGKRPDVSAMMGYVGQQLGPQLRRQGQCAPRQRLAVPLNMPITHWRGPAGLQPALADHPVCVVHIPHR
jgi:hypothetical protein